MAATTRYPHLSKAPITEAIIDIRVELPESIEFQQFHNLHDLVKDSYPEKKLRHKIEGRISFDIERALRVDSDRNVPDGVICNSGDGKNVFQARYDGFTLSRLPPYENWEVFFREANWLWKIYSKNLEPKAIRRVATRFINKIDLPGDIRDFADYITTGPSVAPRLPQAVLGFMSRVMTPTEYEGVFAQISQFLALSVESGTPHILLDIEIFRESLDELDEAEIWEILNTFRILKNQYFFENITEKTVSVYL